MSKFRPGLIVMAAATFVLAVGIFVYLMTEIRPDKKLELIFFKSAPAKEIMLEDEFKYYTRALEDMECELASILLNTAFTRHYRQFKWASIKRNCAWDEGCSEWDIAASVIFDELGDCIIMSTFTQADNEIRAQNLIPPKFNVRFNITFDHEEHENPLIANRNLSVSWLIRKADVGHIPALLKIAELLQRGDVFVQSAEAEYYVLKRACFLGYDDCASLEPRLNELQDALAPERVALIEQRASIDPFAPTFLTDLLIDGKM